LLESSSPSGEQEKRADPQMPPIPDIAVDDSEADLDPSAEDYLTWLVVERGRARNTLLAYRRDLVAYESFLRDRGRTVRSATRTDLERHVAHLLSTGHSAGSASRALTAVRGLYRFRAEEGMPGDDPTIDVAAPKTGDRLPKALTEDEVIKLLDAASGTTPLDLRDKAMLELLYGTGMRVSELVGLSLGDIGSESGLIKVLGKGSKERLVPVGRFAEVALDIWLDQGGRPELAPRKWARRGDAEAVFLNFRGRRITRQGVWEVMSKRAREAHLRSAFHPHVLRHSCATHMLARGADIRVVQELLGHASVATTQIYTRVKVEHLRTAYESAHPRATGRARKKRAGK
jgi:integrase/recombinase XerD